MATLLSGVRTSLEEVRDILEGDSTEESGDVPKDALTRFVNMAHLRTDDVESNGDLASERLRMIEMNLAAHYATSLDPQPIEEEVADASFRYKGDTEDTEYKRNAIQLDTTGTLTGGDSKPTPSIDVLEGR